MQASMLDRHEIEGILASKVAHIVFEKKDGSLRTMKATTNLSFIPKASHPMGFGPSSEKNKPVYDVEAEGWRSFRWDSLKEIE